MCKVRLFDGFPTSQGTSPPVALALLTSLSTGSHAHRNPRMQPQATIAVDMDITPAVSLSTNLGVMHAADDARRFVQAYGGASLGFALGGSWSGFAEVFTWWPASAGGSNQAVVDAGIQLLLGDDVILDGRLARTTGDGSPSTSGGIGVSFRW